MKSFVKIVCVLFVLLMMVQLSGCGETFSGVTKDAQRIGKGFRTIFIRDHE